MATTHLEVVSQGNLHYWPVSTCSSTVSSPRKAWNVLLGGDVGDSHVFIILGQGNPLLRFVMFCSPSTVPLLHKGSPNGL